MSLSPETTAAGRLQRAALALLRQHEADGALPTSARFLYYELKQDGYPLPAHTARRPDQDVIDAVKRLRDAGAVPWEWIADESRSVDDVWTARTVADWVDEAIDEARLSPWDGQPRPVIVCESRGVRAAVRSLARRYAVPVTSTNGQAGGFLVTDVAPMCEPGTPVGYLGDHNPAGGQIEGNARRVLSGLAGPLDWQRIAVTPDQAAGWGLLPKPGTDGRYSDGNPHDSYEAEAVGQSRLVALTADWLAALCPEPIDDVLEREARQRAALRARLR